MDADPPTLISPAHRAKCARLAERIIDEIEVLIGPAVHDATWIADAARAARDLDAISRGPV